MFNYVTQVLNVSPPEVYFRPEQQGGMQLANTREKAVLIPSLVVGAELLQGRGDKELAFPLAAYMTKLRPEHYLRLTIQTNTELGIGVHGGHQAGAAELPGAAESGADRRAVPDGDALVRAAASGTSSWRWWCSASSRPRGRSISRAGRRRSI